MRTLSFLLAVIVTLTIVFVSLNVHIYNEDFYFSEFEKNGVYDEIGKEQVLENYDLLMGYFKNENNLKDSFFNEKEKWHMKDVKNLILRAKYLLYALTFILALTLLYFLIRKDFRTALNGMIYGGIATAAIIGLMLAIASINFPVMFLQFHFAFFTNELWQLNPETDKLIVMFPEEFFYDSFGEIFINSLIIAILNLIVAFALKHYIAYKKRGDINW